MQPFRLTPACKDYLWGGTRLKTAYGKRTALPVLAESWELSAHPEHPFPAMPRSIRRRSAETARARRSSRS